MKLIPLTQGQFAIVDDEDYEYLSQWKWYAHKNPRGYYAVRASRTPPGRKRVHLHREILNPPDGMDCDHINGDGLDNRRCNLRVCTRAENARNQQPQDGYSSRFKGVTRIKQTGKWRVRVKVDGRSTHLGYFTDEIEAARAYDRAARELHGEFARTNFHEDAKSPTLAVQRFRRLPRIFFIFSYLFRLTSAWFGCILFTTQLAQAGTDCTLWILSTNPR